MTSRKNEFLSPVKAKKMKLLSRSEEVKSEDLRTGSASHYQDDEESLSESENTEFATTDQSDKENKRSSTSAVLKSTKGKTPVSTVGEFKLPSEISVNQLFQKKELKTLTSLFNDISTNKTEKMFKQYKDLTENKLKASDLLIQKLANDNNSLRSQLREALNKSNGSERNTHNNSGNTRELDRLTQENKELKKKISRVQEKLEEVSHNQHRSHGDLDSEVLKSQIVKKLTNLECLEVQKTDELIAFKLRYSGDGCVLFFELQLHKTSKDTVYYVPDISNESETEDPEIKDFEENAEILKEKLDKYLLTNLEMKVDAFGPLYSKLIKTLGIPRTKV